MLLLAAALLLGAFLRLDHLGEPSYWLDEILHHDLTTAALQQPWWRWLTGFSPEHGPLYYATQLAARLVARDETAGRLAPALFGIAAIALVWLAARSFDELAAATAALLLAASPLHVYYSREARAYALLMFATAALLAVLLRGRSPWLVVAVVLLTLYTSATAAPVLVSAFVVASVAALLDKARRRFFTIAAIASFLAIALLPLLYAATPVEDAGWPGFPHLDAAFFTALLHNFSVSALGTGSGRTAVALLCFAAAGAIALLQRDRTLAAVTIGMTLLPLALALASLRAFEHFYATRYVTPALTGYLVLAGIGVAAFARLVARRFAPLLAAAIVAAFLTQTWHAARTEAFQKLDWRGIAAAIHQRAHPGDLVLTAEPWSEVSLRFYLERLPRKADLRQMSILDIARGLVDHYPATFLVTAGFSDDTTTRNWMCSYPLLLASPLENFRLHYAREDYLAERATDAERRAFALGIGARSIRLATTEDPLFRDGWAAAEGAGDGAFRWAIATRATIGVPRWFARDRVIRFSALPMSHPSLPPQTLRVSVNGTPLADTTPMSNAWRDYAVNAPARVWRDGVNVLTFDFARATAPAAIDPHASDRRPLAASFAWISIDDRGAPPATHPAHLPAVRMTTTPLLDERALWRDSSTRFAPARLRRDAVMALIARLGYDPVTVWPRIARGDVHLDDLVHTLDYGSECIDDATFVNEVFHALLDRAPGPGERREKLVERITRGTEFRKMVTR
ncbi:MAG: glycosyltransferase family 39 protein [Acidobacteria bacterium]|nr:glycosyltransferase family 39 protein [Acidobacteriota bacterium]MBV9475654.1 glycosyltransferase family 39 protein [Acidobacteriota bacterium]